MTSALWECHDIEKHYGRTQALKVDGISLVEGDRLLVRGPNGCGKSTLLRMMAGLAVPDKGSIAVNYGREARVGYLPQAPLGYVDLTLAHNIMLLRTLFGGTAAPKAVSKSPVGQFFSPRQNAKLGSLSGGYRRVFALEQICTLKIDILIIDEPLSQLDDDRVSDSIDLLEARVSSLKLFVASLPDSRSVPAAFEKLFNKTKQL